MVEHSRSLYDYTSVINIHAADEADALLFG